MHKNIAIATIILSMINPCYADDVQQGAEQFNWQTCVSTKKSECLNTCINSSDIDCDDNCVTLATDKCQSQGIKPTP